MSRRPDPSAGPLRVVHVSTPLTWRGGEQQVAYLYRELERFGVAQTLVCRSGSELARRAAAEGFDVLTAERGGPLSREFARTIRMATRRLDAGIVHAHDAKAHTEALLAGPRSAEVPPVVVSRRVAIPIGRSPLSRRKYDHRRVRRIICSSHAIERVLRPDIARPERLTVIHDGIDVARFTEAVPDGRLRRLLGTSEATPLIGTVGALEPLKDQATFVRMARGVIAAGFDARFVIIGEGPLRSELERMIDAEQLSDRVSLVGFRDDVPEILPELDVFVMTSRSEGLGTSILDAMAAGVPVVATWAGGIPEIVEDGVAGLLANVGHDAGLAAAVCRLLSEPELRIRLVESARVGLARFSTSAMATATMEVYRGVLNHLAATGR